MGVGISTLPHLFCQTYPKAIIYVDMNQNNIIAIRDLVHLLQLGNKPISIHIILRIRMKKVGIFPVKLIYCVVLETDSLEQLKSEPPGGSHIKVTGKARQKL